jgi:hypothetical protein
MGVHWRPVDHGVAGAAMTGGVLTVVAKTDLAVWDLPSPDRA